MTTGNGSKLQWMIAAVVVAVTVFTMLGLNGAVSALQARVAGLEADTAKIEEIEDRLVELQAEANELASLRDDILAAVCAANARTPRELSRCDNAAAGGPRP